MVVLEATSKIPVFKLYFQMLNILGPDSLNVFRLPFVVSITVISVNIASSIVSCPEGMQQNREVRYLLQVYLQ